MEQNINTYVDTLFMNMKSFTQEDGLIGKPVVQGDKTFLPVISITLGYGGGDSKSRSKASASSSMGTSGNMLGDAMGLGAKLCTDAIIIIDNNDVSVTPIGAKGGISQLVDKVPQILSGMGSNNSQQGQQQNQQNQQSQQSQ